MHEKIEIGETDSSYRLLYYRHSRGVIEAAMSFLA